MTKAKTNGCTSVIMLQRYTQTHELAIVHEAKPCRSCSTADAQVIRP